MKYTEDQAHKLAHESVYYVLENIVLLPDEITDNSTIRDLGIDSLDLMEISMELEDMLSISVFDDDLVKFDTVDEIVNFITKKLLK